MGLNGGLGKYEAMLKSKGIRYYEHGDHEGEGKPLFEVFSDEHYDMYEVIRILESVGLMQYYDYETGLIIIPEKYTIKYPDLMGKIRKLMMHDLAFNALFAMTYVESYEKYTNKMIEDEYSMMIYVVKPK